MPNHEAQLQKIEQAAQAIKSADALLIGAGAGIGVDSGLPDFRGENGFWKAYPVARQLGLSFYDLADPIWFDQHPERAWGFYGHRYNLYLDTNPHFGFQLLQKWINDFKLDAFVFTSNVDGHFSKAGFDPDRIIECHGSINYWQCLQQCGHTVWSANSKRLAINEHKFIAEQPLPECPGCGGLARPNILMFGDSEWDSTRTSIQQIQFKHWQQRNKSQRRIVAVEIGCGTAIPTVRVHCESLADQLIRINPSDSVTTRGIGIPLGALKALNLIDNQYG